MLRRTIMLHCNISCAIDTNRLNRERLLLPFLLLTTDLRVSKPFETQGSGRTPFFTIRHTQDHQMTQDIFSISSFDPTKVTESFRDFAEKGVSQSRDAYAKMKTAAEEAGKTIEATVESAQSGTVELSLKAINALRTNAETSLSHMEALIACKSLSEVFELQTSFIRKQAEIAMEQARSMQETTRKVAENLVKPGKEATEKAMSGLSLK